MPAGERRRHKRGHARRHHQRRRKGQANRDPARRHKLPPGGYLRRAEKPGSRAVKLSKYPWPERTGRTGAQKRRDRRRYNGSPRSRRGYLIERSV